MRGIDDLDVSGRVVLLRADLNVPLDGATITDDGRIRASLPTIAKLAGRGARVLICAHLGRPKGTSYAERAAGGPSLAPVAARLAELLGGEVPLAADVAGPAAARVAAGLADGEVAMLENVRFEPAETSKDDAQRAGLAARLAALAQLYVGDGFGALHRKHASVYDLPALLPHAAGDLVLAEVAVLRRLTQRSGPALRRGARRREAVGQARRHREPARQGRPPADRRRDVLHVPEGPGPTRSASRCSRPTRSPQVRQVLTEAAERGRGDRAAGRPGRRDRLRPRRRARGLPGDRVPGRPREPGHGPGHPRAVRGQAGRRGDRVLERPGRGVRVPGVRRGHPGGGRGHQPRAAG